MKSNMSLKYHKDVSFSVAVFYLKIVGLWLSTSLAEKWFRNALVTYTVLAIIFNMWMQLRGLYFSWGDFSVSTYIACNSLGLFMDLFKLLIIFIHKKKFLYLVVYMQKNFWHFNYNQYEKSVLADAKRMCIYFVCVFSFLSQSTIFSYIFMPLISNIGKNKSDRVPIFHMHLDLPLNVSPYYEMTYLIQALTLYQVGVCYLCVDNIFCIMCLHVASQFRILQYRIANVLSLRDKVKFDQDTNLDSSDEFYAIFRKCIQQHQALIRFCTTLEEIFTVIILGQVLTFSILICFVGYQALLVKLSLSWRISLVSFLTTNICQLWIFTYSCNALVEESMNTANAAYAAPWIYLPMDKFGEMTRKDLQLVLMRSRRACYLTACGFFPISLETFTKIMSSAMSYFTILKQRTVDTIE
ncbi:odorant receptor 13a-like [Bombus bifarius]|uniref:Odorant receptor n=2 Tax=Pyrobombus TaxID=144703 RepID=A0A6P8LUQ4_9HYME|nr:odorant receptor 13a-like [Bombus vancouverensis nearcticus]XP_033304746.1 odorant receptor 13a-like [Bombus bifarius]